LKIALDGPTPERLKQSGGHVDIGDNKQGGKVYTFRDNSLSRIYADMAKKNGGGDLDQLRIEYVALRRFREIYERAGRFGSVGSVDWSRTGPSSPFGRDLLAETEAGLNARDDYRNARACLTYVEDIVVQNIVCNELSLEIAGFAVGKKSETRAKVYARQMLRSAGAKLAAMWNMT
jgi:hypothetical protein